MVKKKPHTGPPEAKHDTAAISLLAEEDGELMLPAVFTAEELLRWLEDRAEEHKNTEMRDNARKYVHVIYALAEAQRAHALAKTEEKTCPEKAKEEEAGISTVKFNAEVLLR